MLTVVGRLEGERKEMREEGEERGRRGEREERREEGEERGRRGEKKEKREEDRQEQVRQ